MLADVAVHGAGGDTDSDATALVAALRPVADRVTVWVTAPDHHWPPYQAIPLQSEADAGHWVVGRRQLHSCTVAGCCPLGPRGCSL